MQKPLERTILSRSSQWIFILLPLPNYNTKTFKLLCYINFWLNLNDRETNKTLLNLIIAYSIRPDTFEQTNENISEDCMKKQHETMFILPK